MKLLVIGGGGREHAVIRKLRENKNVGTVYCAPGNGGIAEIAQCVPIKATEIDKIVAFAKENKVDLVVVTPDDPLVAGMVDALEAEGIRAFGPRKNAAIIEGSKAFSKNLMKKYHIPTAAYEVFDNAEKAIEYIKSQNTYPTVIKADGLALGKGVIIAESFEQAEDAVNSIMKDKIFGASGGKVVVEEFMRGREISVLAFCDGKTVVPMVSAQDHKRVFDGDKGPNTGGMGAYSPSPIYDDAMAKECMEKIFRPTMEAMNSEGRPFKGVIYFGLMATESGVRVVEYNARFGDPETQAVLPRLKTDLLDIFNAVIDERLDEMNIEWRDEAAACVIMASGGYPGKYPTGLAITGIEDAEKDENVFVYHAGTKNEKELCVTSGGRVLGVTAMDETLDKAIYRAYKAVKKIHFNGAHYRTDIGKDSNK
ncbi:MAG: phosphoribosylamine--glycine ligase [Ruminococcaceae bacterium]|nr:phosphoribosylamine--glycine ligase [Oscillospiraceae bacterium]